MKKLEVFKIHKSFDGNKVCSDVSIAVNPGSCKVIIGPNGAGKSTLLKLISGQIRSDSGEIWFDGNRIDNSPLSARRNLGISQTFQLPSFPPEMTISEVLSATEVAKNWLKWWRYSPSWSDPRILNDLGLFEKKNLKLGGLSVGDKKLLDFACAVSQNPNLILLDEPTAGMSESQIERVAILLRRMRATTSILMVEHDLSFVRSLKNSSVAVMARGEIVAAGDLEELEKSKELKNIYFDERELLT